jgi:hypothetical protein
METKPRMAKRAAEKLLVRLHSLAAGLPGAGGKFAQSEKAA